MLVLTSTILDAEVHGLKYSRNFRPKKSFFCSLCCGHQAMLLTVCRRKSCCILRESWNRAMPSSQDSPEHDLPSFGVKFLCFTVLSTFLRKVGKAVPKPPKSLNLVFLREEIHRKWI